MKRNYHRLVCDVSIIGLMTSLLILLSVSACRDTSLAEGDDVMLSFSSDTIRFDTVFTQLGSATRSIRVYNTLDQSVSITDIRLEDDGNSFFRLNVDGVSGQDFQDVTILPNDSIWVFVEVTIDPDMPLTASPFVIDDIIRFSTNGNEQVVQLEAWGQNANYIPSRFNAGEPYVLPCVNGMTVWNDPKPYVIYGRLIVQNCELVIPAGTSIYVHGGIVSNELGIFNDGLIIVDASGKINIFGEEGSPVTIQGDRLESEFEDVKGQWAGIRITDNSKGNEFHYTQIKNSVVGVRVDSAAELTLRNSIIGNTSNSGLIGIHASIQATNTLIHSNTGSGLQLVYGGDYDFKYCTVASYENQSEALALTNYLCTDPLCLEPPRVFSTSASFTNCIFSGFSSDEIFLDDISDGMDPDLFEYSFDHSIVRVDELLESDRFPNFFDNCDNCLNINSNDTLFVSIQDRDFHLDSLSIAEMKARPLAGLSFDIEGNARDNSTPDIGCYEYQY